MNKWTNTTGSSNCFRVKIITDLKSKFKGLQNEPPYDRIPEAFVTVTEISKTVLENLTLGVISFEYWQKLYEQIFLKSIQSNYGLQFVWYQKSKRNKEKSAIF